jgi:hypothetical protein
VQIRLKIPAAADPSAFGSKDNDTGDSFAIVMTDFLVLRSISRIFTPKNSY